MSRAEQKSYLSRRRFLIIFFCIPVLLLLSYLFGMIVFKGVIPDFLLFNGENKIIEFSSLNLYLFGSLFFFPSILISSIIAFIRNRIDQLRPEMYTMVSGLCIAIFFVIFSYPLMMSWAHIHHYHLDHYEPAHKGGWYIFKINETP